MVRGRCRTGPTPRANGAAGWRPVAVLALTAALALAAALPAAATAEPTRAAVERSDTPSPERSRTITLGVGAVLPFVLLYELPGPWLAGWVAWRLGAQTELVASADLGLLLGPGATRVPASLGLGVRLRPWRGPLWGQLGLGGAGYVERIGVQLPERDVRSTDLGIALTLDAAFGLRITRKWEIAFGYDHRLVASDSAGTSLGPAEHETLPQFGTAMLWLGRQL